MSRVSFNRGWTVRPKVSSFSDLMGGLKDAEQVTLPHDAMIGLPRSARDSEGPSTGFFPGGTVEYTKSFDAPDAWRDQRVWVEFQGVYRDAMIFVNGMWAGQRPNGYAPFRVPLDPYLRYGEQNLIRVEARAHQDSRWYSGLGILRDTFLRVAPLTHLEPDGIRVTTLVATENDATFEVATTVRNEAPGTRTFELSTNVRAPGTSGVIASDRAPVTIRAGASAVVRQRFYLDTPQLWSPDSPHLYEVMSSLRDPDDEVDVSTTPFGLRTLRIDPRHGLRINGATVKLRGACIHHDNGILGGAAFGRAEERRIEILKAAGFNAIRSSHNVVSPAMLDACDRLGMLVIDESFDMWLEGMKAFDYSLSFAEWWERDIEAMVVKDYNHPSVIVYSIGNEIPEAGSALGAAWGRRIVDKIRSLDATRFTTNAVSSFWAVSSEILADFTQEVSGLRARGVNDVMNAMNDIFERITTSELVTERTAESHSVVDIAGLNYAESRYRSDGERFPNRVILGTETNPRNMDRIWSLVTELPYVIGDFTWTGWDYLGEVGLGRTDYPDNPEATGGGDPEFPWLLAWCGDIDITGQRRPASYYREIVFGLRREPYIAVYRPQHYGVRRLEMQWAWSDTVSSWSWDVGPATPIEVEVYSEAEEVELLLNGTTVGRAGAGPVNRFRAHFQLQYDPGTLTAVAYSGGVEQARTSLASAAEVGLHVIADRSTLQADTSDLAFIAIELRDADGNLGNASDRPVSVNVEGPGILQALGSAQPSTEERLDSGTCTTFDGRALAVVRPAGPGRISVSVSSQGLTPRAVQLIVEPADSGD